MKFKCVKCGKLTSFSVSTGADKDFIQVACQHCHTMNRISRQKTKVVSDNNGVNQVPVAETKIPGWIFVHDEHTASQSFDLKPGKNLIGRKSSLEVDIAIDTTDSYMSRRHCSIDVIRKPSGGYDFLLSDNEALNGTFINAQEQKRLKAGDVFFLRDGDTIQLGMTKMVIRTGINQKREQAEAEVNQSSYMPTVLVKRNI